MIPGDDIDEGAAVRERPDTERILRLELESKYEHLLEDLADRKRTERELQESKEKFSSLFSSMSEGVCLHEILYDEAGRAIDYRILDVNPSYESVLHIRKEDAVGKKGSELYGTTEPPYLDVYAEVAGTGIPTNFETYFPPMDRHFLIYIFSPGKGKFATTFTDITERKRIEETLRRSEALLEETELVGKIGGWDYTVATGKVRWTSEVYRIHEVSPDFDPNDISANIRFYSPEDQSTIERAFHAAMTTGESYSLELQFRTARGTSKWVRTIGRTESVDGKIVRVYGNIVDITERKEAEEERKKLEMQLLQAQKIESIGTLAAGVAHDFNNILNIVMGNANLIAMTPVDLEKLPRHIQAISTATERGAQLVKQLLTFARKTDIEQRTVVINDLILDTAKLFEETFPKTIDIQLTLTPALPDILGDVNQLYQILMNLCVNSRDAMPGGGTLTIATDHVAGSLVHRKFAAASAESYA